MLLSIGTAYLGYRQHHRPQVLVLTALSGMVMYLSIYVWMSDALYLLGFLGLMGAGIWGLQLAQKAPRVPVAFSPSRSVSA